MEEPLIGRTIGHYEIIEKIGEGGMGAVYRARDIRLDRSVALKMLPGEAVANSERKRRFALEARAASALNHPNIITIYDIDVADGVDFIAMEYVAGQTLADVIPPGGMEPARAIQFAAQIADALAMAHQSGIVHRDLKPSNIMVNEQGRVKVLDFGLAKLIEPTSGEGATQTAQTRVGVILGTVAYMAPEQAEGKPVDQRADIFSFGVVLYEMLSGVQPFVRNSKRPVPRSDRRRRHARRTRQSDAAPGDQAARPRPFSATCRRLLPSRLVACQRKGEREAGELRRQLHQDAAGVVTEPEFGFAILGKDPFRPDCRTHDDGRVPPGRHLDRVAPDCPDDDRVPVGLEVPVELPRLPDRDANRPDEVHE